MEIDLKPYFDRYEKVVAQADQVFEKVKTAFPHEVRCQTGCADCCHALFDLTLIEALYLNHHFVAKLEGENRERLVSRANKADRSIYKIKRQAYRESQAGKDENQILEELADVRVRCPLLNDAERCDLYAHRPITCRLYGIPTAIGGKGHTCGLSAFKAGERYPTVNLDLIHQQLYEISKDLVKDIKSKFSGLGEILVPLSMAILTDYNEVYLGIRDAADEKSSPGRP
jgi:Fe-S-cluster containining protein